MPPHFQHRREAGQQLARLLTRFHRAPETVVIALPRGGVPVAAEIAQALELPLEICLVRKLGVPWQPEVAMGALAMGGVHILHRKLIDDLRISPGQVEREVAAERLELERRDKTYRGQRPWPNLRGKTAIVVDDGIATGATAEAAIEALRQQGVSRVIVAAAVAGRPTVRKLSRLADDVICVLQPEYLTSVGEWFVNFASVSDDEVRSLLARCWAQPQPASA